MIDPTIEKDIADRIAQLPQVVRDAITSADTEAHLRDLAKKHTLHLDQWEKLENQVMLTLLAFKPFEDLEVNIAKHVGVSDDIAHELTESVLETIFEPMRESLERELGHPEATSEEQSDIEKVREAVLHDAGIPATPASAPLPPPATPPALVETKTVLRGPASGAYKPGEASTTRRNVIDDPYREPAE